MENKKKYLIIGIIISFVFVAWIIWYLNFFSNWWEDNWICDNGTRTKHDNPSMPMPTNSCPSFVQNNKNNNTGATKAGTGTQVLGTGTLEEEKVMKEVEEILNEVDK